MADFNRFQYSYFLPNGAQIVIREDAYDTFKEWVEGVLIDFPASGAKTPPTPTPAPQTAIPGIMCEVHNIPLKDRLSKTGKPYKSHVRKLGEEWDRCFGKGWMSELDNSKQIANKLSHHSGLPELEQEDFLI